MKPNQNSPWSQIPHSFSRNDNISAHAKVVALVLDSFNPKYPSLKKICQYTGLSKPTVCKAIAELVSINVLEYKKGCGGKNFKNKSNTYTIKPESDWNLPSSKAALHHRVKDVYTNKNNSNKNNLKAERVKEVYSKELASSNPSLDVQDSESPANHTIQNQLEGKLEEHHRVKDVYPIASTSPVVKPVLDRDTAKSIIKKAGNNIPGCISELKKYSIRSKDDLAKLLHDYSGFDGSQKRAIGDALGLAPPRKQVERRHNEE
jgi:DNA-binding transcriptional regulator GbsR (MarR family)